MLAAAVAAIPELARGLSTSLALWSSQRSCPDCHCNPTLQCPDVSHLPDSVCQEGLRVHPAAVPAAPLVFYLALVLCGIIIGARGGTLWTYVSHWFYRKPVKLTETSTPTTFSAAAFALSRRRSQ